MNDENVNLSNFLNISQQQRKNTVFLSGKKNAFTSVDDILNDGNRPRSRQNLTSNGSSVEFSLPEVAPAHYVTKEQKKANQDNRSYMGLIKDCIPSENVRVRGVEESVLSALRVLPQRDVVDALSWSCQFSSNTDPLSLLSKESRSLDNCMFHEKVIAKALVASTSVYVFPQRSIRGKGQHVPTSIQQDRHHDWCEALCSVYDACRSRVFSFKDQDDPSRFVFYVVGCSFTAMFQHSEKHGMVAALSHSTPGMRKMFSSYGIKYVLHNPEEGGKGGLIVLKGYQNVHGLFDMILNDTMSGAKQKQSKDVPRIYAPAPFQNAALVRYTLNIVMDDIILGTVCGEKACSSSLLPSRNKSEEDKGFIPPWVLSRLRYYLYQTGASSTTSITSTVSKDFAMLRSAQAPDC